MENKLKYKECKFLNLNELSRREQKKHAKAISEITHDEPNMLPLSVEEVLDKNYIGIMHHKKEGIIAFAAVSKPEKNSKGCAYGEIGMMYTVPHLRKQGIGHQMLVYVEDWARTSGQYDGLIAFLCEASIRLFAEAGYKANDGTVPQYYFDLCKTHCKLHEGAEKEVDSFTKQVEIAQGRHDKRETFFLLMDSFSKLPDLASRLCLEILTGNVARAGLCCPIPVYKDLN